MEIINSLLKSLNCVETDVLKSHIKSHSGTWVDTDTKILKLIELVLTDEDPTGKDAYYSKKLYGKSKDDRFEKLKSRLKNKIMESLLMDVNIERKDVWDDATVWRTKVKKKLASLHLLIDKGHTTTISQKLFTEITSTAKQYEVYPELIECLYLYKYTKAFRVGENEYNTIGKEIEIYEQAYCAVNKAKDCYNKLLMKTAYSGNPQEKEIEEFLRKSINELREDYKSTQSPTVNYYLKLLEFAYCNIIEDHPLARDTCFELLNIVSKNKSIYLKRRMGAIYDYLCGCEMNMQNYMKASAYARNAQYFFAEKTVNFSIAREHEFYACFYDKDYEQAGLLATELLNGSLTETGFFRLAKYEYLYANVLFKNAQYKEALQILQKNQEILKDKSGWNIGVRVLTIMSLIKLGHVDSAALNIENFRKHLERSSKELKIRDREKSILKLLQYMEKEGFMFDNIKQVDNVNAAINKLKEHTKEQRWEPMSQELIPFHEWVESEMMGTSMAKKNLSKKLEAKPTKEITEARKK
jgi:hypothetical protein